ncbi:MAG: reprolysin-like metallopeptidase [Flavobacterium sp.]|uniref:fibronectin type III domain-containing protein n=1 Tax=Flavobacterium sp. TaxID=239 RepID=UPI003262E2FA
MKIKLLSIAFLAISSLSWAQNKQSAWASTNNRADAVVVANKQTLTNLQLFALDVNALRQSLTNAPQRFTSGKSNVIVSFPNANGQLERFRIKESSNMDPALAARYPEIKSYIGQGEDTPGSTIYFSLSPLGLQTMVIRADQSAEFIEPYTTDLATYAVYKKADKAASLTRFECRVIAQAQTDLTASGITARPNADDATLRTYRLAMSVTGEYTAYFGGTKALALAAINNTMTRVNGVFEKDFSARMVLIANTDSVIYTSASTDPYSPASGLDNWNLQLMNTLVSVIGNANFDVGHLFGATGGGGNAGCIGCVCSNDTSTSVSGGITSPNNYKGSGYTSPNDGVPSGDNFDIDYVAHEMGHQFGANHTFTHSNEGTGVQMEPGSGSTIMGYAGITDLDIQAHSDPYFHSVSVQQVTNFIKTTTCQTNTATGNSIPTANAGLDYTIPKSTPFMLTGSATDANGDTLTYCWEQFNSQSTAAAPSATKTTGVNYRSYSPTTSPTRYFPKMSSVLTGATTTAGSEITVEALSSVARTLNFRMTVRDNRAGGAGNNSDDTVITVNATAGPFSVTAPNTAVSYVGGSTQTVTWAVAGTTANGVNCANVDILISTNAGTTWTTLLAATPNDGTQAVTIPNTAGTTNRIMVKGTNHVFFDVSNANFTITAGSSDTTAPTAPTSLTASGMTQTTTNLSWTASTDNVGVTGYDVYQGATLKGSTTTATTFAVTGLTASTAYAFTVKAKDLAGNISAASNTANVTTLAADTTAPSAPTTLTASGTTYNATNLSWTASTDNVAVTGYDIYQGATLKGSTTTATTFAVTGLIASTAYAFTVKAKDAAGNVSAASNTANVTTPAAPISYCASQGNSTADERIGKVVFGTINNTSTGTAGYEDFTAQSTAATRGTDYTITVTPAWTSSVYPEGYAVFIDYNQNGLFTDAGETVWSNAASTTTPVSGSITIPATAALGNTRMRVSMKYNAVPTSCEAFSYGQVEDYTVNIQAAAADTTAPTAPTSLAASGTTQTTTDLSWTASTDNVAVTGYDVYKDGALLGSTTTATTYAVTGLTASTAYAFTVKAKDAAGNVSAVSNTANVTTSAAADTTAPTAPTSLTASGTTQTTTDLSWTASTDNVAVTGYDVYKDGALLGSTTTATTYAVTGLTASTAYAFTVKAKDAAGNVSAVSNTANVTTSAAPDTTAPSAPSSLTASGTTQTTTDLSWTASTDNVAVTGYDVYKDGALLGSTTTATTYAVTGLTASTAYAFTVKAKDAAGNVSAVSNTANVTTLANSSNATDLMFTEYIEGSSNNKALEIGNNTGAAVSLSIYTVKKQTNGAGTWSTGIALTGTLNNGAKFVLVNSSINIACYTAASANVSTAGNELTFNGNDAVGLFKNGVLIDIIGTFDGGTANFAIDVTLRRKSAVLSPNTTFNLAGEWDSFATDTCGGLNNRPTDASTNLNNIKLYPNPVKGDFLNVSDSENATYRILNTLGQQVAKGAVQNGVIAVSGLNSNIYLLELEVNGQTVVKRFIKE